jgi:hypothetical protein
MPIPLIDRSGKRQPRALVVGLRRVVKDSRATVAQRLKACELLAIIEGYVEGRASERNAVEAERERIPQNVTSRPPTSPANARRLRELANEMRIQEPGMVSPGEVAFLKGHASRAER